MPCAPGSPSTNQTTKMNAGSAPSAGLDIPRTIWVEWQGRRYGPYLGARDARREGFIIGEAPIETLPLGWPVKWPEIPKLPR